MNRFALRSLLSAVSVLLVLGCKEFYGTSELALKPGSTPAPCQAPPLEKNIVGTWHFESNYNPLNAVTSGRVTFTAQGTIIDPDSLFTNYFERTGFATSKTYNTNNTDPIFPNDDFVVIVYTKKGREETTPFRLVTNECKRIVLGLRATRNNEVEFILTR